MQDIGQTMSVIATRKVNGEAAHLSCMKYQGIHYICAGSKVILPSVETL